MRSDPYIFSFTPLPPQFHQTAPLNLNFEWLDLMGGCQQDPRYHAEGDVLIHTSMVARALTNDHRWQELDEQNRSIMYMAALLHDVAKPATTIQDEAGHYTSPKHAVVGERMAREILLTDELTGLPNLQVREQICKLVRYHGLPLRFIDKPDPERAIIEASLVVPLNLAAMLARADINGRITKDMNDKYELYERLLVFEKECQNLGCWDKPMPFDSDHHRFMFCVAKKDFSYVPYDDTRCEVMLMCGLPASGKSTWVSQLEKEKGLPVISLDGLRDELDVDPEDEQGPVVNEAKERAKKLLRQGKGFIWDATNITRDCRGGLISLFARYGARTTICYIESDRSTMFKRNRERKRQVPEGVIKRMINAFEMPSCQESHGFIQKENN